MKEHDGLYHMRLVKMHALLCRNQTRDEKVSERESNERKNVTSLPVQRNGDLALVVCPTPARFFKYDDKIQIPLSLSLMDDELERRRGHLTILERQYSHSLHRNPNQRGSKERPTL